jgi:hypothetical protein
MNKGLLKTGIFLILLIVAAVALRSIILGGRVISLEPAGALDGTIAQSLVTGKSDNTLLKPGKDFTVKASRYYEKNN